MTTGAMMKAKALGVGVLAYFAYGIVFALVDMFVGLPDDVNTVGATVIFLAAVATGVWWYRSRTPEPSEDVSRGAP